MRERKKVNYLLKVEVWSEEILRDSSDPKDPKDRDNEERGAANSRKLPPPPIPYSDIFQIPSSLSSLINPRRGI